jgi:DNA-binding HxlR family transcriptional regulator
MSLLSETNRISCPLDEIINLISKKWTLLIISVLGNNQKVRYSDILRQLKGINSKTLSDRLKELEIHGLIKRKAYAEIPPRVEYSLTKKGTTLRKAVLPLMKWAYTYNKTRKGKTPCDAAFAEEIGKI